MKRIYLLLFLFSPIVAVSQTAPFQNYCVQGATQATVSGLPSSNYQQGVIPGCTVYVYLTGTTTLATIYSDATSDPLTNPFTADNGTGQWLFYAATGQIYDCQFSGGIYPNTYSAPLTVTGCFGGGGGGGGSAVTQLIAGTDITLSPTDGLGIVTINSSAASNSVIKNPTSTQVIFPPSTVAPAGISLNSLEVNDVFYIDGWIGQTATWCGTWSAGTYALHCVVTDGSGHYFISVQPSNTATASTGAATTCSDTIASTGTCYYYQASAALTTGYGSGNLPTYVNLAIADITAWLQTANQSSVLLFGPLSGGSSYPLCDSISIPQVSAQSLSLIGQGLPGANSVSYLTMQTGCTLNRAMIYKAPAPSEPVLPTIKISGFRFFGGHLASSAFDVEGCQGCEYSNLEIGGGFTDAGGEPAPMNISLGGCCNTSWVYQATVHDIEVRASVGPPTYSTGSGGATQINNCTISGSGGTATLGVATTSFLANGNTIFLGGLTACACLDNGGTVNGNGFTVTNTISNTSFQVTAPNSCSTVGSIADSGTGTVYTTSGGANYTSNPVGLVRSLTGFFNAFTTMPTNVTATVTAGVPSAVTNTTAPVGFCSAVGNCAGSGSFGLALYNNSLFNTGLCSQMTDSQLENVVITGLFTTSLTQTGNCRNGAGIELTSWPNKATHIHSNPGGFVGMGDHNGIEWDTPQFDSQVYVGFHAFNGTAASHGSTINSPKFSAPTLNTLNIGFVVDQNADLTINGDLQCSVQSSSWMRDAFSAPGYGAVNFGMPTGGYGLHDHSYTSCVNTGANAGPFDTTFAPVTASRPVITHMGPGAVGPSVTNSGVGSYESWYLPSGDTNDLLESFINQTKELTLSTAGSMFLNGNITMNGSITSQSFGHFTGSVWGGGIDAFGTFLLSTSSQTPPCPTPTSGSPACASNTWQFMDTYYDSGTATNYNTNCTFILNPSTPGLAGVNTLTLNCTSTGSYTGTYLLVEPYPTTHSNLTLTSAAPAVSSGQIGYGSTTAAASNCNQGGTLTSVTTCIVVNIGGTTHYVPVF